MAAANALVVGLNAVILTVNQDRPQVLIVPQDEDGVALESGGTSERVPAPPMSTKPDPSS